MCIAICKPAGAKFPSDEILHCCWNNNDDGAGFAYPIRNGVLIQKGFMNWEDYISAIHALKEKIDVDATPMLMHFRIATHGARDATMTHPFPVQYDDGVLKKTEYVSDYAVIHNGVISMCSLTKNGLSDTATFVKEYLTLLSANKGWIHSKENMELIHKLIGSKMAFIDKYGNVNMTAGFEEHEGVFYSNTSYKENRIRKTTYYHSAYDYYDDDDYSYDYHYSYNTKSNSWRKEADDTKKKDDVVLYRQTEKYDDVFFFTNEDSNEADKAKALMRISIGDMLSVDGMDYPIDSQREADSLFIDRKRNVWEKNTVTEYDNKGQMKSTSISYSCIGCDGHVYRDGKEKPWNPTFYVSKTLFSE